MAEETVDIGGYLIPTPQAKMYQALRQAILTEVTQAMEEIFDHVQLEVDEAGEEYLEATNDKNLLKAIFYLNPSSLGRIQKAYEQGKVLDYVREQLLVRE